MGAMLAWFTALILVLGGILTLSHLGLNVDAGVSAILHGIVRMLAHPLYVP